MGSAVLSRPARLALGVLRCGVGGALVAVGTEAAVAEVRTVTARTGRAVVGTAVLAGPGYVRAALGAVRLRAVGANRTLGAEATLVAVRARSSVTTVTAVRRTIVTLRTTSITSTGTTSLVAVATDRPTSAIERPVLTPISLLFTRTTVPALGPATAVVTGAAVAAPVVAAALVTAAAGVPAAAR